MRTFFTNFAAFLINHRHNLQVALFAMLSVGIVIGLLLGLPPVWIVIPSLLGVIYWIAVRPWWNTRGQEEGKRSFRKEKNWGKGLVTFAFVGPLIALALDAMLTPALPPAPPVGMVINNASFNKDATLLAGSNKDRIQLHKANETLEGLHGQEFIPGYRGKFIATAFSQHGDWLALADNQVDQYSLRMWDMNNRRLAWQRFGRRLNVVDMQVSPNGTFVITLDKDAKPREFKNKAGKNARLAVSANSSYIAVASGKVIDLYDRANPDFYAQIKAHHDPILAVAFDEKNSDVLYSLSNRRRMLLHTARTSPQNGITFTQSAEWLPVLQDKNQKAKLRAAWIDPAARLWIADNKDEYTEVLSKRPFKCIVHAKDSLDVFALDAKHELKKTLAPSDKTLNRVYIAPGEILVGLTHKNEFVTWSLKADRNVNPNALALLSKDEDAGNRIRHGQLQNVKTLSFAEGQWRVAEISNGETEAKTVRFWNLNINPEIGITSDRSYPALTGQGGEIALTAFDDQNRFFTVDRLGYVRAWDYEGDKGALLSEMQWNDSPITHITIAPNKTVFVANQGGAIRKWIWDRGVFTTLTLPLFRTGAITAMALDTAMV